MSTELKDTFRSDFCVAIPDKEASKKLQEASFIKGYKWVYENSLPKQKIQHTSLRYLYFRINSLTYPSITFSNDTYSDIEIPYDEAMKYFQERISTTSAKKCDCDPHYLLHFGCKCGGI